MALNVVWIGFFLIAFLIALYKSIFLGDTTIFKTLTEGLFDSAKTSVTDVALPLVGTMTFLFGIDEYCRKSRRYPLAGAIIKPIFKTLVPEVPDNHPAMGEMVMNFSANMLGLDNAATPFGLKAMQSLQSLNPEKDIATNAQIMFLVLHTSGLTLIPLSVISYRVAAGSTDATSVFIPCVAGTVIATLASIIIVSIKQRIRWDIVLISWIVTIAVCIGALLLLVANMNSETRNIFTTVAGNFILLLIVVLIITGGAYKKVSVFDTFIEGAKNGFDVVLKVIPYLVGFLVGIRVFRDSGALGYITDGIAWLVAKAGMNTNFVPALPVSIMVPFSGAGSRGLMLDIFKNPLYGPDSFVGKTASVLRGSADTTFYIIALYFGSVGIKKVRYAIWAGLAADLIGVLAAICIAYIFFT